MVSDAEKTFRFRGIQGGTDRQGVERLVRENLRLKKEDLVLVHSLAANPLRPEEQVVTLSFDRIPETLSNLPQDSQELQHSGTGGRLIFDTHFEGLTPLHSTKDDECDIEY